MRMIRMKLCIATLLVLAATLTACDNPAVRSNAMALDTGFRTIRPMAERDLERRTAEGELTPEEAAFERATLDNHQMLIDQLRN